MGLTVRQVVESIAAYGIMPAGDAEALRTKAQAELDNDADPLLRELVAQGKLTKFQAANLYAGKGKGLVFGEYLILDKIGAGGMGHVYKAQHRRMKRIVALKALPPQSVGSQRAVQRFYQEVEVAAKLMHPNIVTAYDAGEAHGMLYLVMEFVDGKDLSSYVGKHGPLALEQTLNVILQTARGLAYAHSLGIIHRDVKPSNLLVNRDKVVKILDMGLARAANPVGESGPVGAELTVSGEVMGTVDYMAPEQAVDTRSADHRADIYALGCTLYRLYIGRAPYAGETAVQKILAHRDKPIPSLQEARPETPDMVERLYKKMVAKNLNDRPQTMAAVVSSIEKMLAGVDEERSSVMLGNEPPPEYDDFMPSGAIVGGSSLGNLPDDGSPAQSGVQKRKAAGSSIGGAAASLPQVSVPKPAARLPGDTDAPEATAPESPFALRPSMAKTAPTMAPAPPKKSNVPLILGGSVAAAILIGVAAFFGLRSKEDPAVPPDGAIAAVPPTPSPSASKVALAVPTATAIASGPAIPPLATSTGGNFFVPSTPPNIADSPSDTPSTPSPSTPPAPPAAVVPTKQEELTGEVDLLAMIDPAKHKRRGTWERQGAELVCPPNQPGEPKYLDVPFIPPPEYDLTFTAVPERTNAIFGPGIVVDGRSCDVLANDDKLAVSRVDGVGYDNANPTFRQGRYFTINAPITVACAVRKGRVVVMLNDQRLIDAQLSPERLSPEHPENVTPGRLYLRGERGLRVIALRIGPPLLPLTPPSTAVNLAAAFEQTNVVEGSASSRRGEVLLNSQANNLAKLKFNQPHGDAFTLRAVIEPNLGGNPYFSLTLPVGSRRITAVVDWRDERVIGLNSTGPGGADINPTGRRVGTLLTPGESHVVEVTALPEPQGVRFRLTVDGREYVDHTTNTFFPDGGADVPDPTAVGVATFGANWRIIRLDQFPADGVRAPVPNSADRTKAAEAIAALAAQADAKGVPLDAKLLTVDLLRKKAATELGDPALRYEALDAAIRIASSAGDLTGTYEAIEDLATAFDVEARGFHPKILETFKTPRTATAAKQQFVEDALDLMQRAARCEEFELAMDLNAALDKFPGATNADLKRELKARASEYEAAITFRDAAIAARAKLIMDEKDAASHTAIGKYLCVGRGDWATGLKELAQGDDLGLQLAAGLEVGDTSTGDAKFTIAEKWLELSDKEKSLPLKWAFAERAAYWYRRAAINVADVKRPVLIRQLTKIAQLRKTSNGAGGPRRPLDAVKIGDHWYQVYPAQMHYDAAATTCENLGGHLIVLDNDAESQAVAQFVMQRLSTLGTENGHVWLGAHDADKEGSFRRLDGVPLAPPAYFNWAGGEPNNFGGDEDYVSWDINYSSGQISTSWRDGARWWGQISTVCEWDH